MKAENNYQKKKSTKIEKGKSLTDFFRDYVVVDLETTGLNPSANEIIEIGAVKVKNCEVVETFNVLVKPRWKISSFISNLTGITNEMVKDAPLVEEILPEFFEFVGNSVVVGHNVNFDINFLTCKSKEHLGYGFTNDFVDTMRLSRKLFPNEAHHRLCDLEMRFNLKNENAHRALSDVVLTNDCYNFMSNYVLENNIDLAVCFAKKSRNAENSSKQSTKKNLK